MLALRPPERKRSSGPSTPACWSSAAVPCTSSSVGYFMIEEPFVQHVH